MHLLPVILFHFLTDLFTVRRPISSSNMQRITPLTLQAHLPLLLNLNPPVSCSLNSRSCLKLPNNQRILSLYSRVCPLDSFSHKQLRQIPFAWALWRHSPPGFHRSVRRAPSSQHPRVSTRSRRRMATLERMRFRTIRSLAPRQHPTRSPLHRMPIHSGLLTAAHSQALQVQPRSHPHI